MMVKMIKELRRGMDAGSRKLEVFNRVPWTEEPGRVCPWGQNELGTTEGLTLENIKNN